MTRTKKKKSFSIDNSTFQIVINVDGSCEGNPGRMGLGGIIIENYPVKKTLITFSEEAAFGTNNEAEYLAIIKSLEQFIMLNIRADSVLLQSDSRVVIKQLNESHIFNHAKLAKLKNRVKKLEEQIPCEVCFVWIPRELNREADELASNAIKNNG